MSDHPEGRRRFWPTRGGIAIVLLALATMLLAALYLFLPKLITTRLPAEQIRRLGFADFSGEIFSVGPTRTTAGRLVFGRADLPALSIGALEINYSPTGLRDKRIASIVLSDVVVNVALGPDGVRFPGFNPESMSMADGSGASSEEASLPMATIGLDRAEIRSGRINLNWGPATFRIPFEADIAADGQGFTRCDARLRMAIRDQPLIFEARLDLDRRLARFDLDAPAVALGAFADLVNRVPGLDASGAVRVKGAAGIGWAPFTITDAHADLSWLDGHLAAGSLQFAPMDDASPAELSVTRGDAHTWQFGGGGWRMRDPLPVLLETLSVTLHMTDLGGHVTGSASASLLPMVLDDPIPASLKERAVFPLAFDAAFSDTDGWSVDLVSDRGGGPPTVHGLTLDMAGVNIRAADPRFSMTAAGDARGGNARWNLSLQGLQAKSDEAMVDLPSVAATGNLRFSRDGAGMGFAGEAIIQLPGLTLGGHGLTGKLDGVSLSARVDQPEGGPRIAVGRLTCTGGRLDDAAREVQLSGLRLDLPWGLPYGAAGGEGAFAVDRIVWQKREVGTVNGHVRHQAEAYAVNAVLNSQLLPGLAAAFGGSVSTSADRLGQTELTFQVPDTRLPAGTDLGRFVSAARGVTVTGTLSARGKARISSGVLAGTVDLSVAGGELAVPEKKITVAGIDAALRFPELPRIRSAPAQNIRFARAAMGGIVVDGGSFEVQVESDTTLLVEKGRLSWCGGKVDAQSLRITAGRQDYNLSLYCQRLGLSRILEQLGAVNAKGTGTVNGRIPIVYNNGKIRFDDGFLFSTPGEGGQIQLTGTDILTRGIPADSPQFAQVELAREALKDYAYDWAKLGLMSEGEDFIMRLQFNGRPSAPLPFVYRKELGGFVRVEAGGQGSVFQGIGLDVNLRLPLNQLLQYKEIVNMIQ